MSIASLSRMLLLLSAVIAPLVDAAFVSSVSELPNVRWDFIVIGGGNAGNVLANRLTENPKFNVLVLEAGPSNEGVLNAEVPFFGPRLAPGTPYDYNYTTVAQTALGNRVLSYPRGHILGGSSTINYMIYTRGAQGDYNRFAAVTNDQGWSWRGMVPYFKKYEKWTAPADGHNQTGQFDPSVPGYNGLVGISLPGWQVPINSMVMSAINERAADGFAFNLDYNTGKQFGMGYLQSTVAGAARTSSATSYLSAQFINRPNLFVFLGAEVSRVIKTGGRSALDVRTVEFRTQVGGPLTRLTASKELLLSAGAVASPHILLNSGIGDATALKAFNIPVLANIPDVGRNLSDHPVLGNHWFVNSTDTYETRIRNATIQADDLQRWQQNGTGPFVDTVLSHIGWMRVPPNVTVPVPDPAGSPNSPHMEIFVSNGIPVTPSNPPAAGNFIGITTAVISPVSRGNITLGSNDPFAAPVINPALLTDPFDKVIMREAVKKAVAFANSQAFDGYILNTTPALGNATDDASIDAYVAANSNTIYHPVGSCAMSATNAKYGVVNPDLRVKGIKGLRIVDGSVFPFIISGHPQSTTYAFAERASDLIKAAWS